MRPSTSNTTLQESIIKKIDRRTFLKASGMTVTGIILGMQVSCSPSGDATPFSPDVFLTINADGSVILVAHRSEMGTGIRTSLPLIIADELEADWKRVKVVQAEGDESKYGNQNTDGSFSVRMFFEPMRKTGAMARMMLEQAAANQWGVPASECKAVNHEVVHEASGKKLEFGKLAADASKLAAPKEEDIIFKKKSEWKYIGKSTSIVDIQDIISGNTIYGLDVNLPGIKYATVLRCPVVGGTVKHFSADRAKQFPGVLQVLEIKSKGFPTDFPNPLGGIVVVADSTWSAISARKELEVEWDLGPNATYATDDYFKEMLAKVKSKGHVRREQGSIDNAISGAAHVMEATYMIPHLAHAPMEPPCAVASVKDGKCEVWAPTQHPQWAKGSVAGALNLEEANVTVNVTLLGGAFGRKSKPDYIVEAALASQMSGFPIKLIWTREDDIQHDFFHACSVQHIRVAFDKQQKVTGWNHRSVFPPIGGTADAKETEPSFGELQLGMVDFPYDIPNISCESHEALTKTRIGWLRSVSNIQHAFAIGSMLDEVAAYRKVDPVANLIELLGSDRDIPFDKTMEGFENYGEPIQKFPWSTKRLRGVIELVADKSGWGKSMPKGHGLGICAHRSFLTYVACVVHVVIDEAGKLSIPEVHYAVDCGIVVNRNSVINQFEGGAVFASGAALKGGITFKDGHPEQTNFDSYFVARMNDCPKQIFVHLVESDEKPTGVGEPPVPPFAPALANAIFAATGKRNRTLPITLG
ncbi:MAG: molybdopterin-dependent oxidoreductase [Cyclobacteriaceae bacterium]|nr:molybdopterin-dependent oxidoreductase [Cyclobacteriaceae bacterium]